MQTDTNAHICWLIQNFSGSVTPNARSNGWEIRGHKLLVHKMPTVASTDPVIAAAQAAVVVPFFQYNPPMMAAPAPAVNIVPVRFHQKLMYCVCVKTVLKSSANPATAATDTLSAQMCCRGDIARF